MTAQKEKELLAEELLKCQAVVLRPQEPFTWSSGWKSPIYCDNRLTLSYPDLRTNVCHQLVRVINQKFSTVTALAGVATAGIPQGALIADRLALPFLYVRSKPKSHGRENLIEGRLPENAKVVVVEDLISTGGSSLKAVEALRQAGAEVIGLVSIFTYGFEEADKQMAAAKVPYHSLTDYDTLTKVAFSKGYISEDKGLIDTLQAWRKSPATWSVS